MLLRGQTCGGIVAHSHRDVISEQLLLTAHVLLTVTVNFLGMPLIITVFVVSLLVIVSIATCRQINPRWWFLNSWVGSNLLIGTG